MPQYGFYDPDDQPREKPKKRRNGRARYRITERGQEALGAYRSQVAEAQAGDGGRDALEAAQSSWAELHAAEAVDALLLDELESQPLTILELTRALDDCGVKRPTVEGAIERLATAELVEPVSTAPADNDRY